MCVLRGVHLEVKKGDIWDYHNKGYWIVIPTNGFVKKNGECVMGRGLAWQAKQRFPELPLKVGKRLKEYGNKVFTFYEYKLITFPVKHNWMEAADPRLIQKSAIEINAIMKMNLIGIPEPVYLPMVGCGNGRLKWSVVSPILNLYLDRSKFVVVEYLGKV